MEMDRFYTARCIHLEVQSILIRQVSTEQRVPADTRQLLEVGQDLSECTGRIRYRGLFVRF